MSPDNESRRRHRGRDRGHGSVVINSSQIAPLAIEIGEGVFGHVVMLLPAMAEPIGPPYEVVLARGWTHVWASPIFAFREPARPWSQLGVGGELRPGIKLRGSRQADNQSAIKRYVAYHRRSDAGRARIGSMAGEDLAEASKVGVATIRRAESVDGPTSMTEANAEAVSRALEAAGVIFRSLREALAPLSIP